MRDVAGRPLEAAPVMQDCAREALTP